MLSLERLQNAVAQSVLGKQHLSLSSLVAAGRADPYRRLRIYENNTRASLTATLTAVFPVTVHMVDERFFRYAASEFIRQNPPAEPRLVRYGAEFPNFLKTFECLAEMPFVAETARLEWGIAEALDAASLPPLAISALDGDASGATPELALQPSLRLIISHWPVLAIWAAHQNGGRPDQEDRWQRSAERIALWRQGDNIRFVRLTRTQFSFRYSLMMGLGLEKAVSRSLTHEPMFDLLAALVSLFQDGLVTGIRFDR